LLTVFPSKQVFKQLGSIVLPLKPIKEVLLMVFAEIKFKFAAPTNFVRVQGCQMVSFQTQNPNLDKFWMPLDWKMLIYFMAVGNILQTFGIF
jgi:hypothetical protein